jgi:HNH endonuclease
VIRLHKGQPPDILVQKAAAWTAEYRQALAAGGEITKTVRFRYRHPDIKEALRRDSHNKCIYCESPIGFGQTDHINPVSLCPDQILEWLNLALVCTECNTYKSDYYNPSAPLINPYIEDPDQHLHFLGPLVMAVAGSEKGLLTERQLRLNRPDLFQRRVRRLESLSPLLNLWAKLQEGQLKELLRATILEEAADDKEYAATVRACLLYTLRWAWPADHV